MVTTVAGTLQLPKNVVDGSTVVTMAELRNIAITGVFQGVILGGVDFTHWEGQTIDELVVQICGACQ